LLALEGDMVGSRAVNIGRGLRTLAFQAAGITSPPKT
jgi:hypothetical protein